MPCDIQILGPLHSGHFAGVSRTDTTCPATPVTSAPALRTSGNPNLLNFCSSLTMPKTPPLYVRPRKYASACTVESTQSSCAPEGKSSSSCRYVGIHGSSLGKNTRPDSNNAETPCARETLSVSTWIPTMGRLVSCFNDCNNDWPEPFSSTRTASTAKSSDNASAMARKCG